MSEFFAIKCHGFLVRTMHRSGSPSEKQSFNGFVECSPLETKCVVDEAQAEEAARRIGVQFAVGMMEFRYTDERRAEQTVPGVDIGFGRTNRTKVNVAGGTFLASSATTYGQAAELCKHLGRWVACGDRCRQ